MTGLLKGLVVKLVRGHWGAFLPGIFRAAAEGEFGEPVKRLYWFAAKYKTVTGAALLAVGAGLETLAASYPEWTWAAPAATWVYTIGGILTAVGLVDGGTRAPWPTGTPKEPQQ